MSRPLSELPIGTAGIIERVAGARTLRRRLMELGLVPGTEIAVINVAPLGDPLELEVRGCRLSIRHREAEAVQLRGDAVDAKPRRHLKVRR